MSATTKNLLSLVVALVGLLAYLGIYIGMWVFGLKALGNVIYYGIGGSIALFILLLAFTFAKAEDPV